MSREVLITRCLDTTTQDKIKLENLGFVILKTGYRFSVPVFLATTPEDSDFRKDHVSFHWDYYYLNGKLLFKTFTSPHDTECKIVWL